MSIRLRLTLLYSTILALTLILFGATLYLTQAETTLNALKQDLEKAGRDLVRVASRSYDRPGNPPPPAPGGPSPLPPEQPATTPGFTERRQREIVRVLDAEGVLSDNPFNQGGEALPLSPQGLAAVREQKLWWEIATVEEERLLILNLPVVTGGQVTMIVQAARPLTERDRSLRTLATTLIVVSILTILVACGSGWLLAGITLQPIHRITQTAQAIGRERDFTRRVDYTGPQDEIGRLATTFNAMLTRLQEAYQRVERSLEMQRNFVADVSHELRTPLTTLRGNLGLLRRTPPIPPEEQADILSDMVDESDRLIRLVNDLLVLARADAGRNLAREPVAVYPVVEEACRQAQQLDPGRPINFHVADGIAILGDRDALKQVLLILLDNALKHSTGIIEITASATAEQVAISVHDQGPGIPRDRLEYVFDRFYRGEEARASPGFGLGLPIARALVEGQGGTITVDSQVGQGSVFTVKFPVPGAMNRW